MRKFLPLLITLGIGCNKQERDKTYYDKQCIASCSRWEEPDDVKDLHARVNCLLQKDMLKVAHIDRRSMRGVQVGFSRGAVEYLQEENSGLRCDYGFKNCDMREQDRFAGVAEMGMDGCETYVDMLQRVANRTVSPIAGYRWCESRMGK